MTLLMRDSIAPALIPLDNLAAVAGYGDGRYQWSSEGWARFQPPIVPLVIVVNAWSQGDILDVETGDAIPEQTPGWWDRFNRPDRRRPTIYCNRSTIDAVRAAMVGRPFDWWAATLDGTQDVPGAVAVQYRDFGGYDESVIHDPSWLGAIPPTSPAEEVDMLILKVAGAITGTLVSGELVVDLAHTEDVAALETAGVPVVTVTTDLLDAIHAAGGSLTGSVSGTLAVSGQLAVK